MAPAPSGHETRDDSPQSPFDFSAVLWVHQGGAGSWHFVTVPEDISDEIADLTAGLRAGFGSVKVQVTIGATTFATSVFPSAEHRAFILPIKKAVRTAERLTPGEAVEVRLHVVQSAS